MSDTMKALSVKQPWAHFILSGGKDIENRVWETKYRGPLLIHAGQNVDVSGERFARENSLVALFEGFDVMKLQRGGIIGIVDLVDCINTRIAARRDKITSPWADPDAEWWWVLDNPRVLPFTPYKGKLGLFNVDKKEINYEPARK